MSIFSKVRKVLTVITDVLLIGRNKGWWSEKHARGEVAKEKGLHR